MNKEQYAWIQGRWFRVIDDIARDSSDLGASWCGVQLQKENSAYHIIQDARDYTIEFADCDDYAFVFISHYDTRLNSYINKDNV
jgi:hypothetical protein